MRYPYERLVTFLCVGVTVLCFTYACSVKLTPNEVQVSVPAGTEEEE